jgi:2,5-dihydroxypyridine 5,6-dioxygenase
MQEMINVFREELELCGIGPGQKLAVLSEGDILQDYSEAFLQAGEQLGAETSRVNVAATGNAGAQARLEDLGESALTTDRAAMETLKDADMVVDLMLLLFSKEQLEIQAAGTRMLLAVEPFEILKRLKPTKDIRRRVEAGEQRIHNAETLRFTNSAGTDVRYDLKPLNGPPPECVLTEYGYTDTPGRWDHWPSGFLASMGTDAGIEGRVVMDKDDIVLPWKEKLSSPIDLSIREGYVTEIAGGGDAKRLREYMEGYEDPRAYAVSHIGWGLNEDALWDVGMPGICMDGRAYYGNVLFSTGPNTEFGGDNDTKCHLDLPMRNCSLWLDDELIVQDGHVVPEDMRAPGR